MPVEEQDTLDKKNEETEEDSSDEALTVNIRYIVIVALLFSAVGVYYALTYFPELSLVRAILAGSAFGLFCATCAGTYSHIH